MAWLEQALMSVSVILLDHAHCERKAASVALNLMARYPECGELVQQLTAIAQEELTHFAQVNAILAQRQIPVTHLTPPPYGAKLNKAVRKSEPDRLLDSLLVAGLIEARSHERLGLLAQHLDDRVLAQFYQGLMASEARHYGAYWLLANTYTDRAIVMTRLEQLASIEAEILVTLHPEPRIHS